MKNLFKMLKTKEWLIYYSHIYKHCIDLLHFYPKSENRLHTYRGE